MTCRYKLFYCNLLYSIYMMYKTLYKNYWYAADKHLKVCKYFISHGQNDLYILHNIFYLCGYVLECISTYSIYKHFEWDEAKDIKKNKDTNFIGRSNFSFWIKDGAPYYVQNHRFQDNQFQILEKEFGKFNIPIINKGYDIDSNIDKLYHCWNSEIRYMKEGEYCNKNCNLSLLNIKGTDIKEFIDITEKIFNSLTEIVGGP